MSRIGFFGLVVFAANMGQSLAACPSLLILERTTNKNRVHYEADPKNPNDPITARWEMIEKGPGIWEELTALEQKRAYGVKLKRVQPALTQFSIVGVPSKTFTLGTDGSTGCPVSVFLASDGTAVAVSLVQLTMKKTIVPAVQKVQFIGSSLKDGRSLKLDVKI